VPAETPPERTLRIPAESDHLSDVRAFVRETLEGFGAPATVTSDLVQAVDEAVCNVILHGYAGAPGEIEIAAQRRDGEVEIRIRDRSRPFDPTAAPSPDLAAPPLARKPGGMGIHLLREAADAVHHQGRADGGNELRLVRRIDVSREEG
jgi:anti-sigma regulatory factor (Ser/Thr protein kinase)